MSTRAWLLVAAIFAGTLALAAISLRWFGNSVGDLGSFGDWVGGFGTLLGLVAAAVAVFLQGRELGHLAAEAKEQAKASAEMGAQVSRLVKALEVETELHAKSLAAQTEHNRLLAEQVSMAYEPAMIPKWERSEHKLKFAINNDGKGLAVLERIEVRQPGRTSHHMDLEGVRDLLREIMRKHVGNAEVLLADKHDVKAGSYWKPEAQREIFRATFPASLAQMPRDLWTDLASVPITFHFKSPTRPSMQAQNIGIPWHMAAGAPDQA